MIKLSKSLLDNAKKTAQIKKPSELIIEIKEYPGFYVSSFHEVDGYLPLDAFLYNNKKYYILQVLRR